MNVIKRSDTSDTEQKGIGFAVLLVTVGVIWLLYNIDLISTSGVNVALRLWPLALVVIGADLLLRRQSPRTSDLIVVGIAVLLILAVFAAPRLGIGVLETKTGTFTESIDRAESATIDLHPGVGDLNVRALETEDTLFNAEVTYIGDVTFDVDGTRLRQIDLGQNEANTNRWLIPDKDLRWNIGLTPDIPLNLSVNTGVGDAILDFTDLNLTNLTLAGGVGSVDLALSDQEAPYLVTVTGGVGDLDVRIPENVDVDLSINSGVGDVEIELPDDAAVRVTVTSGIGRVRLPSWLERTNPGADDSTWQSSNFEDATRRITIDIQSGIGGLTIR